MDFEDIIERHSNSLGGMPPKNSAKELAQCFPSSDGCFIEITITHPHTKGYVNMPSEKQKRKLSLDFHYLIAAIPALYQLNKGLYFEFDKTGNIHGHGWIEVGPLNHYPIGMIADMARAYLLRMPKKYSQYRDGCMFADWGVYKCPQIKLKYDTLDSDRIEVWKAYCVKLQN